MVKIQMGCLVSLYKPRNAPNAAHGYMPGSNGVDSIIVGYHRGQELVYVGRVRARFVTATRSEGLRRLRPLGIECVHSSIFLKQADFAHIPQSCSNPEPDW